MTCPRAQSKRLVLDTPQQHRFPTSRLDSTRQLRSFKPQLAPWKMRPTWAQEPGLQLRQVGDAGPRSKPGMRVMPPELCARLQCIDQLRDAPPVRELHRFA